MLTTPCQENILAPLHRALLPKIKLMMTFPTSLRSAPVSIGGLDLQSAEITSRVQEINHLILLITISTPSKLLLISALESHQLEVGVPDLFLTSSFSDFFHPSYSYLGYTFVGIHVDTQLRGLSSFSYLTFVYLQQ